jgi:hypothetical protein
MQVLKRDYVESRKRLFQPRLSTIWRNASRELVQVKSGYGDAAKKKACALGAIAYYSSNGKTCDPMRIPIMDRLVYANMVAGWERLTGEEVSHLNDKCGWSFEMFAETAKKLGI